MTVLFSADVHCGVPDVPGQRRGVRGLQTRRFSVSQGKRHRTNSNSSIMIKYCVVVVVVVLLMQK